jgi:hypothetical protein
MRNEEYDFGSLKLFIERDRRNRSVSIWLDEKRGDSVINWSMDADGVMTKTEIPIGQFSDCKPFIKLPWDIANLLFQAIQEHQEADGVKAKSTHNLEGQMEAQSFHLEDMRKLVFSKIGGASSASATTDDFKDK